MASKINKLKWEESQLRGFINADAGLLYHLGPFRYIRLDKVCELLRSASDAGRESLAGEALPHVRHAQNLHDFTIKLCDNFLREVPAGASTPNHGPISKPGRPDSATVGTLGSSGKRLSLVTAKSLNFPALT